MTETEYFLNKQITIYLMVLKISPNLKGYSYLKSGTLKIIDDLTKKRDVNNRLYCELSQEYNVEKELIDRAMRHAIEVSVKRDGIEDFEKYSHFEFSSSKPTPREVLCVMAERLRMDLNNYNASKQQSSHNQTNT